MVHLEDGKFRQKGHYYGHQSSLLHLRIFNVHDRLFGEREHRHFPCRRAEWILYAGWRLRDPIYCIPVGQGRAGT